MKKIDWEKIVVGQRLKTTQNLFHMLGSVEVVPSGSIVTFHSHYNTLPKSACNVLHKGVMYSAYRNVFLYVHKRKHILPLP